MFKPKKTTIFSFLIFLIAFFFRIYKISTINQFEVSGDQTGFLLSSLKIFDLFSVSSFQEFFKLSAWIINFSWGYFQIVFSALWIAILSLLEIPICEWTVFLSYILLSSFTVLNIFHFTKKELNLIPAFFTALLIGIMPIFVSTSRVNLNWHLSFCLLMNCVLFFYDFLKYKVSSKIVISFIFLALYLVSDSQFLGIFPVFIYGFLLVFFREGKQGFKELVKKIPVYSVFFPVITFGLIIIAYVYFSFKGHSEYGFLGHNSEKEIIFGFYWKEMLGEWIQSSGLFLTLLVPFGLIGGIYSVLKKRLLSVLFVCSIVYLLPWLFIIHRSMGGGVNSRCYMLNFMVLLNLFSIIMFVELMFKCFKNRRILISVLTIIMSLICIEEFFIISKVVYGYNIKIPYYNFKSTYGSSGRRDRGLKSLGMWMRENAPKDVSIFSNLEPPNTRYLFHRKTYGIYDIDAKSDKVIIDYFSKYINEIDIVLIKDKYFKIIEGLLKDKFFVKKIFLFDEKKYYLLDKDGEISQQDIETIRLNSRLGLFFNDFDIKYGKINDLKWKYIWEPEG